jgi:hypothetical protein
VQVTAGRQGVPSHSLIGSSRNWNVAEESAVEGAEAIGITTYSAIFNSSPKVLEPRLVVFDDAHAGEQFVGEEYGVTIRRYEAPAAYDVVLTALPPYGCVRASCREPDAVLAARTTSPLLLSAGRTLPGSGAPPCG